VVCLLHPLLLLLLFLLIIILLLSLLSPPFPPRFLLLFLLLLLLLSPSFFYSISFSRLSLTSPLSLRVVRVRALPYVNVEVMSPLRPVNKGRYSIMVDVPFIPFSFSSSPSSPYALPLIASLRLFSSSFPLSPLLLFFSSYSSSSCSFFSSFSLLPS